MTLDECTPGTRVKMPGGATGKVLRTSTKLKMSVLVQFDHGGGAQAFRPGELAKAEEAQQQSQVRPVP